MFRGGLWLKIAWPKCKEGRVPITDVCEMGWKNSRAHLLEGWRDFRACVNVGKYSMGPLVDGGGRNILVSCICRTRFQCPDVEVGLRFQDPCGGGGGGGWGVGVGGEEGDS